MKAREIKKTLLNNYKEEMKDYEEMTKRNAQSEAIKRQRIQLLENILFICFGISETFDSTTIDACAREIASDMKEMLT